MKNLTNILFIENGESMSVDENTLIISQDDAEIKRESLSNIAGICYYSRKPVRLSVIEACAENNVRLNILYPDGQFIASVTGGYESSELRRKQYEAVEASGACLEIANKMIMAKGFNSRWLCIRAAYDYDEYLDHAAVKEAAADLEALVGKVIEAKDMESLMTLRKEIRKALTSSFNLLITDKEDFFKFKGRRTKPPIDPVNALLSFGYANLEDLCIAALESVGFDPYVGFFNREKQGVATLAFDLMEEFRACIADRYVVTMINDGIITASHFEETFPDNFELTEEGLHVAHEFWLKYIQRKTFHTFFELELEWWMVPYASAILLGRSVRGENANYPPFLQKKTPKNSQI
jgi:CRISPR-associated protein Cas1